MTDTEPPPDGANRDSLTEAFDENAEAVASFVDRLDAVDDLLAAAVRGARALGGDADEAPSDGSDAAAASTPTPDDSAADRAARAAGVAGRDGDDLAAAVAAVAELHRNGELSGVTDALTEEDAIRGAEALLDAYRDPAVEGGAGYLAAVANALEGDSDRSDTE